MWKAHLRRELDHYLLHRHRYNEQPTLQEIADALCMPRADARQHVEAAIADDRVVRLQGRPQRYLLNREHGTLLAHDQPNRRPLREMLFLTHEAAYRDLWRRHTEPETNDDQ